MAFWGLVAVLAYTWLGYPLLLTGLARLVRPRPAAPPGAPALLSLVIAACDEVEFVARKRANTRALDYPPELLQVLWVVDGDDGTASRLADFPEVELLAQPGRSGKAAALNRGVAAARGAIVVFSDANAMLCPGALRALARAFDDPAVGCAAGEKRVARGPGAAAASESLYWRYESALKRAEDRLGSVVGAAGELFAVRRELYRPLPEDTVADDFAISLGIALAGYRLAYVPEAWAEEGGSATLRDELTRRMRVAAGHVQAVPRMPGLFDVFRRPLLCWQYVSHKFLRGLVAPLASFLLLPLNAALLAHGPLYIWLLGAQLGLWGAGLLGLGAGRRYRILAAPATLLLLNFAALLGTLRYLVAGQPVRWRRARRIDAGEDG